MIDLHHHQSERHSQLSDLEKGLHVLCSGCFMHSAESATETDCRLGPCICQRLADDALHQRALQQLGFKRALHSCCQHILQQLVDGAGLLPLRISAAVMQGRGSGCRQKQGQPHPWQGLGPTDDQTFRDGHQLMPKGCLWPKAAFTV